MHASRIEIRKSTDTENKCIRFARDVIVCASYNLTSNSLVCRLPEQTNASEETTISSVSANSLRDGVGFTPAIPYKMCGCEWIHRKIHSIRKISLFVCPFDETITFDMIIWSHSTTNIHTFSVQATFHLPFNRAHQVSTTYCEHTSTTFRLHTNCMFEWTHEISFIAQMGFMNGLPKCRNAILQWWPRCC